MKATYTTRDGRITVTGEPKGVKGVFAFLARMQEVLEDTKCGKCGADANFNVREAKGYTFYTMRCVNPECGAQLDFPETKDGERIFPGRRDKDGNDRGVNGWYVWERDAAAEKSSSSKVDDFDGGDDDATGTSEDSEVPF